jgi:hypothetical protein
VEDLTRVGRNDPCPCGSGKKFKKCHLGREGELYLRKGEALDPDAGKKICALAPVTYGRSGEMVEALVREGILDGPVGIRCIDLKGYRDLGLSGQEIPREALRGSAGLVVNPAKTREIDPDHIYLAITPGVQDSTLIHQIAHILYTLKGGGDSPGFFRQLGLETGIPAEQLDHTQEFGYWLTFLRDRFQVELDAEDAIVTYLYGNQLLLKAEDIRAGDIPQLAVHSKKILDFLMSHKQEIDELIRNRKGYIGKQ